MADISGKLAGKEMDENQRKVVSVFTGASDNESITVQRSDGSSVRIIIRKGKEDKGGTKHSLFSHYGTNSSPFDAEDVLLIPEVLSKGKKTPKEENGKQLYEYKLQGQNDEAYHVITGIYGNREAFITFYKSNEVSSVARPTHSEEARAATDNTSSTGKVTQISPTDQTNPQQSATDEGKTLHSLPQGTTPEERARIEEERRLLLSRKQKQTTEGKPGISLRLGNKFVSLQSEGEGGRNYTRDMIEGQAGENMPEGKPISEDFSDVVVQTNAAKLKNDNKELYNAAKAGDRQAADQLIVPLLKHDKLQAIAQAHPGAIVVFPHAEESAGRNKIPAAYASALVKAGAEQGLELDSNIVQANKPGHTGAGTGQRTILRTRFSGEVQAGRDYILVDDVYTSGATMRDLKDYIESKGGNVVFITTMAKGRMGTLRVVPTAAEKQALRDQGITDQQLRQYGITNSIENLTANEVANLRRLLADRRGDRGSSQGQTGNKPPVERVLESPLGEGEGTAESGEVTPRAEGKDTYSLPSDRTLPEEPGYPLRDFITAPLAHVRDNLRRVAEREEGDRPLDWTDPYEAFRHPPHRRTRAQPHDRRRAP